MRILWVSNHTPFLTDFGGGQRSSLIYRALRKLAEVDVLLLAPQQMNGRSQSELHGIPDGLMEVIPPTPRGSRPPWKLIRALAPSFVDKLAHNLGRRETDYSPDPMAKPVFERLVHERKYDLFVGRHLKYSGQAGILGQNAAIVDIDDNEIELYRLIIKNPNTGALRRQVLKKRVQTLERLLPRLLRNGPYLWVSNEDDRHTVGFEHARVLPNIPYALSLSNPPPSLPARPQSKTLLFVGMLSYIYNREGIAWFLNEVWPAIRNQEPDARFRIVGSRLRKQDQEIWGAAPGVEVSGFVKDLKEAYADCAFVVVPVWSGGGTNIKVLEALMYGRTCVLSQPAYRGYGQVFDGENALLVARDANEMIRFCLQLLDNPGRCEAMGQNGAKVVNRQFSYDRFERTVLDSVEVVMRGQRSGIVAAS